MHIAYCFLKKSLSFRMSIYQNFTVFHHYMPPNLITKTCLTNLSCLRSKKKKNSLKILTNCLPILNYLIVDLNTKYQTSRTRVLLKLRLLVVYWIEYFLFRVNLYDFDLTFHSFFILLNKHSMENPYCFYEFSLKHIC